MKTLTLATALAAAIAVPAAAQDQTFVTIGTGGVTGVYYPTGGAISRLVNKDRDDHGLRVSVESTGGSVYNIRTIREGELDFGIAQSDVQSAAYEGVRAFEGEEPYDGLRSVFSIHPEPMHVMVRGDAGIESVGDMVGKRVNIGNPGSGTRVLADVLMDAAGVTPDDFALAAELKSSEQAAALCDGKVDAAIWAAGLPNGATMEATSTCDIRLLDLSTSNTDAVLEANKAYAAATIPGGMYPGNDGDVSSWGPKATIVTDASTPEEVVYTVTKAVFENFEDFQRLHPAFADLTKEEMVSDGMTAPLHPGAQRYYEEAGLM